jgi:hypothetical protein
MIDGDATVAERGAPGLGADMADIRAEYGIGTDR